MLRYAYTQQRHIQQLLMPRKKTEALNLRVSPHFKDALRSAARQQHRSMANMLEVLVLSHCDREGIRVRRDKRVAPARKRAMRRK
jgi:hypothetical protein